MMTTPIDNNLNNNNMPLSSQGVLMTGISKSALRWIVASLSLILFIAIVCLSYSIGVGDAESGAIPIIRADGTAVKVRPDNPGGRQYPHQDLTIYNSFRDDISNKDTELRNDLEKPMALNPAMVASEEVPSNNQMLSADEGIKLVTVSEQPQAPQEPVRGVDNAQVDNAQKEITQEMPLKRNESPEEKINKIVTASEPVLPVVKAEPVQKKPDMIPQAQPKPPVQPIKSGGSYLQIGAYRSESDALVGFNRAKSKLSQLAGAGHNIVKADLGAKGIYYRLRVGPFASKQDSLTICSQLQAKGQPCLYIP